jgi:endo-1,4-beta-xylanase
MKRLLLVFTAFSCSFISQNARAQTSVTVETESGTLGSDFNSLSAGGVNYVTCASNFIATQNPTEAKRVATYTVTFPRAGVYNLYARIRVGPASADDDSFFYGNGFGAKTVNNDADWITCNQLSGVGDTTSYTVVSASGAVSANNVWKWLNLSIFNGGEPPVKFTVPEGNLTQTFQIGGREHGLDFDKFVFGLENYFYSVRNLNFGEPGTDVPPQVFTPTGQPFATGKDKFLGSVYSNAQKVFFTNYWNQVTPENGGKWGSVEGTPNVMNWAELDSSYKLAKDNGFPFKMHTLIWGSQQPTWLESLSPAEQLSEIKEWFAAVAQRYPAIDFIEVVNEPLHAPPDASHSGKYINALGGSGTTGWDWIITAFKLARQYFPNSKLWLNDYSIINTTQSTQQYLGIINLLKAENLIDGIGEQAHAFTTRSATTATMIANLNALAATGLPLYATELDIDGPPAETPEGDAIQLEEFKRVFPIFWEHPAIKGVTMWGHRPGHWRTAQGAPLVYGNNVEKPAMTWLREYIQGGPLPISLANFEASRTNTEVLLTWTVIEETNSDKYVVEKSTDGINFTPIQTIKALGSTNYNTTDKQPTSGRNYYRLVQYDKSGRASYHGIRIVDFSNVPSIYVQIYPNPASTHFQIRADGNQKNTTASITNALGQRLKTFNIPPSGVISVSTADLSNGVYFIKIDSGNLQQVKRLIINKK